MSTHSAGLATEGTIHEVLGIRGIEMSADRVVLEMDVGPKVHQPMGLLHGGASAVIAESAASMGAFLNCDPSKEYVVGVDLNITHLRARQDGSVKAIATPIRKGRTVQVWSIDITDQDGKDVAVARCTLAVRPLAQGG
ncbi:MAG TPA: hotdog fold thioesterase [Actinomycetota bacterium]|nr:hotdog fold thioesterase [Actinomycetota bacterium]